MAHDQEIREQAEELFVLDGMTLEQVAREVDVPERTVSNWSAEDGWVEKRMEYRKSISAIKRNTVTLRKNLIAKALQSLDPQDIYAATRLEAMASRRQKDVGPAAEIDRPKLFLENVEFIIETLKDIDPEGLKILARSFEIIVERFKERHEKAAQAH